MKKILIILLISIGFLGNGQISESCQEWIFGAEGGVRMSFENADTASGVLPEIECMVGDTVDAAEGSTYLMSSDSCSASWYTDGTNIWGPDGKLDFIKNGNTLHGAPSAIATTMFLKIPGGGNKYYVVCSGTATGDPIQLNYSPNYSILDLDADGGNGDIELATANTVLPGYDNDRFLPAEKVAVTPMPDGSGYWMILGYHKNLSHDSLFLYSVTSSGFQRVQSQLVGDADGAFDYTSQMKMSRDGLMFAYAEGRNVVIQSFDPFNGVMGDVIATIDLGSSDVYGVEFSPDGDELFVSTLFGINYSLKSFSIPDLSENVITSSGTLYALQTGPDGRVYYINGSAVKTISDPNDENQDLDFELEDITNNCLTTRISKGLPTPNPDLCDPFEVELSVSRELDTCIFDFPVIATPDNAGLAYEYQWYKESVSPNNKLGNGSEATYVVEETGTFLLVTQGGAHNCIAIDTFTFNVSEFEQLSPLELCDPAYSQLSVSPNTTQTGEFTWFIDGVEIAVYSDQSEVIANNPGEYVVEIGTSCGSYFDTVIVDKSTDPMVTDGAVCSSAMDSVAELMVDGISEPYIWYTLENDGDSVFAGKNYSVVYNDLSGFNEGDIVDTFWVAPTIPTSSGILLTTPAIAFADPTARFSSLGITELHSVDIRFSGAQFNTEYDIVLTDITAAIEVFRSTETIVLNVDDYTISVGVTLEVNHSYEFTFESTIPAFNTNRILADDGVDAQAGEVFITDRGGLFNWNYSTYQRASCARTPVFVYHSCESQEQPFVTRWNTNNDGVTGTTEISIPTVGSGYAYDLYWEEVGNASNNDSLFGISGDTIIDFGSPGEYEVHISGDFPRFYGFENGDSLKLVSIESWGTIDWSSLDSTFFGSSNMKYNAADRPRMNSLPSLVSLFQGCDSVNGDFSNWSVGNVEDFSHLFDGALSFDGLIGGWDMSSAKKIEGILNDAQSFDQDLSNWNVFALESGDEAFDNSGISTTNYDNLLLGWERLVMANSVNVGAENLTYCRGHIARDSIVARYGWSFTDDAFLGGVGCVDTVLMEADTSRIVEDASATNVNVLLNDSATYLGLDASTLAIIVNGGIGSAVIGAGSTIRYTPLADSNGVDTIVYEVCDSLGNCNRDTLLVLIEAVADAPSTSSITINVNSALTNGFVDLGGNITDVENDLDLSSLVILGLTNGSFINNGDTTLTIDFNHVSQDGDTLLYEICDLTTPTPLCSQDTVFVNVDCSINGLEEGLTLVTSQDPVRINDTVSIDVGNAQVGLLYSWLIDGVVQDSIFASGSSLSFRDTLPNEVIYTFRVTDTALGCTEVLDTSLQVLPPCVIQDLQNSFTFTVSEDTVDIGEAIVLSVSFPPVGLWYHIQKNGASIDSSLSTGATLNFNTTVDTTTIYSVLAYDPNLLCSMVLSDSLLVLIEPDCDLVDFGTGISVSSSADSVLTNDTVFFTFSNTASGIVYSAFEGGTGVDSDTSNGIDLILSDVMLSDGSYSFTAFDPATWCSIDLTETFEITTYCPLEDVGGPFTITASADSVSVNDTVFFTLTNSQDGVIYNFEIGGSLVATDTSDGGLIVFSHVLTGDASFNFVAQDTFSNCSISLRDTFKISTYCPLINVGGSFSITASADSVGINDTVFFTLLNSQAGVIYELQTGGSIVDSDTSEGGAMILSHIMPIDASFNILAIDTFSTCSLVLSEMFNITTYCPLVDVGGSHDGGIFSLLSSADSIAINDTVSFALGNPQEGVVYEFLMDGGIMDSDTSDGSVIIFSQVLTSDASFSFVAIDTLSNCSVNLSKTFYIRTFCPLEDVGGAFTITASADSVAINDTIVFTLTNTQVGVVYDFEVDGSVMDSDTSDGGLIIFSQVLTSDASFSFVATDTISNCSLNLSETFDITTYCPLEDVGGAFTITASEDSVAINDSIVFTLTNTQVGVVYDFEVDGSVVDSDTSDGGVITFSQVLTSDASFSFVATDTISNCSLNLSETFDVTAYCPLENVGGAFTITASVDSVAINDTIVFTLTNPQVGVVYDFEIGGSVMDSDTSDGGVITFSQVLTSDASFTFVATDIVSNCSIDLASIFDITTYCGHSALTGAYDINLTSTLLNEEDSLELNFMSPDANVSYIISITGFVNDTVQMASDTAILRKINNDVFVRVTVFDSVCNRILFSDSVLYESTDCNTIFGVSSVDLSESEETCYDTISLTLGYSGILDSIVWSSSNSGILLESDQNITSLISSLNLGSNDVSSVIHYRNCTLQVDHSILFDDDALLCFPIEIFNVVSPNADGVHDYLKIKNIERYSDVRFRVFDRTGQKVFDVDSYDYTNYFRGVSNVFNEIELKDDVYYYQLEVEEIDEVITGHLLLKK